VRQTSKFSRLIIPLLVVITLGLVLAVSAFYTVRYIEHQDIKTKFALDTQNRFNAIKREIAINMEVLQSLRSFYLSSEEVTREEFSKFTIPQIIDHPSIQALEWIPNIPDSKRHAYVRAAQNESYPNFQITQLGSQGKMEIARKREEYFPVYFIEPYIGNEMALGYDLASNPIRLEALRKSRNSGEVIASERITLVQEKEDQSSFIVFVPIYRKHELLATVEDRNKNLVGFVIGVFRIGKIVEHALSYLDPSGIDITLLDQTTSSDKQLLYSYLSRSNNRINKNENKNGLIFNQTINVADRKWSVIAKPASIYFAPMKDWHAWSASIGVMIMALLIAFYIKNNAELVSKLSNEITERKNAVEKYRLLVESTSAITWEVDIASLQFTYVSPQAANILGYPPDMWKDFDFWASLIYPPDREKAVNYCQTSTARGEDHEFEYRAVASDGRIVWIRDIVSVVKENDKPVALRGFLLDVTKRMEAELEREHLLAKLNHLNKELEQVLYITSHDLRSPLVNVQGFSEELDISLKALMDVLNKIDVPLNLQEEITQITKDDIPESLEFIKNSIAKMELLLTGLLKLSRTDRIELNLEETDMNEMMADIMNNYEFILKDSGVKIEVSELPKCTADRTLLNQVFSNLLDNAFKFLDQKRSGVIKVSGGKEGNHSVYCVEDNGIGIASDYQGKIFDIFHQLEPEKIQGEGLGLTIVKKIIRKHSGKVWVESEFGKGSKFYVSL